MANEEHLAILRQGVEVWNAWRKANPNVVPDLRRTDLTQTKLAEADLSRTDLFDADLSGADLRKANLSHAYLSLAKLRRTNLSGTDLKRANLSHASLYEAGLKGAHLTRAKLTHASLQGAYLEETDLTRVNLTGASLSGAHLRKVNLTKANLTKSSIIEALLTDVDLQGAHLTRADLRRTVLRRVNLTGVSLLGARLEEAKLTQVNLTGVDFSEVFLNITIFADVNLSSVIGLGTVRHLGPSEISISTLYASGGKIPEVFLRGCGVPDSLIEYLPSLIGATQPIQFYSCFISYSTKDEAFAKRLHSRMQQEHLRVWFAPEELKGGHKLRDQIDDAIRIYDKLLLILSDASMASDWVAHEIRRAHNRERAEGKRVLFPIRLTDYESLTDWELPDGTGRDLALEVRHYYIPDFSHWKDHDSFEVAFAQLLKALRADEKNTVQR